MLVLQRRRDEKIDITHASGIRIELSLVDIRGDKARLGITAPYDWIINRREVTDAIAREQRHGNNQRHDDMPEGL